MASMKGPISLRLKLAKAQLTASASSRVIRPSVAYTVHVSLCAIRGGNSGLFFAVVLRLCVVGIPAVCPRFP